MLKKRIVVATIALGLSLPALSSASPLSWTPRLGLLDGLTRLWSSLGDARPAAGRHSIQHLRKQGPSIDPTGSPTPPPPGSQSTTPSDPAGSGQ
jgi:hypothetical protein